MTAPLLPAELDGARILLAHATPGLWSLGAEDGSIIAPADARPAAYAEEFRHYGGRVVAESVHSADRALICWSRNNLPRLLDEVARLGEVERAARAFLAALDATPVPWGQPPWRQALKAGQALHTAAADPPTRGRQLVEEVERLRQQLLDWAYPLLDDNHADDETWRLLNEQRAALQEKIRAALDRAAAPQEASGDG